MPLMLKRRLNEEVVIRPDPNSGKRLTEIRIRVAAINAGMAQLAIEADGYIALRGELVDGGKASEKRRRKNPYEKYGFR